MTTRQQVHAEQALAAAQRERFDASVAGDVAALERLLADDLTYVHSNARLDTKTSYINGFREGRLPYRAFETEDRQVRIFGDIGIITAIVHVTLRGAEQDRLLNVRCTSAWVSRGGRWQEVAWHSTRIDE